MYNNVIKSHEQKMSRRLRHIFFIIYMKIQSLTERHPSSMCALLRAILPKGRKRKSLFVILAKKLMRRSPLYSYIIFFVNRLADDAIFTLEKSGARVSQVIYGPRRYRRVEIFILFFYLLWSVRNELYRAHFTFGSFLFAKLVHFCRIYLKTGEFFTFGEKLITLARHLVSRMKFLWLILVFARCAWLSRSTLVYSTHPRQLVFKDSFVFFVEAIT